MVMEETAMTLEELANEVVRQMEERGLSGAQQDNRVSAVPDARTIRYYTTLGLLERPRIVGRQAHYGRRHLLQLLAIKALQGLQMPLNEIQARLYGRSEHELEAMLESIAAQVPRRQPVVKTVVWREVMIEPGLKIMAEDSWQPRDERELEEKIRAVLTALKDSARQNS